MQPSDHKRHIRQALADLIFGLALFALFVLLGVFGSKPASSRAFDARAGLPAAESIRATEKQQESTFPQAALPPRAGT